MKTQINAYLTFNGNCREAMAFYRSCFGGELVIMAVKESPMANQWPAAMQEHILHAGLTCGDLVLLASDMTAPDGPVRGNTISLALNCNSETELQRFFHNLSEGGNITHPLHTFYDGTIGAVTDKYGMNWVCKA
jgi:PhnB protein